MNRRALLIGGGTFVALLVALLMMPWDGGPLAWMPDTDEVAREFEKRHQELRVIAVTTSNGDNDLTTYTVTYVPRAAGGGERIATWDIHSAGRFYGWEVDVERIDVQRSAENALQSVGGSRR